MNIIKFECETVTPMFLAGADGKTQELRAPSIKGLMRFWWRAMNGHLDLEKLKEKEGEIFGASDEKIGRSKFSIRVKDTFIRPDKTYKYKPLPHHTGNQNCPYLPSCVSKINPHKCSKDFKLNAVKPNICFTSLLSSPDKFLWIGNLIKVAIILGGLGKRARRGFGSVRILNVSDQPYNSNYKLETILKLVNYIGSNKYQIDRHKDKIELKDDLTAQYPFLKEIQLGKECDSWEELVKKVGEASHEHDINSLGFAKGKKRLASPIYVSVLKNLNNKYLPIISSLNTVFEDGGKMDDKGQNEFKEAIL